MLSKKIINNRKTKQERMKFKIILFILLFTILSLNSVKAESNPQNITLRLHQVWDFSSEIDADVTDIISTNQDWIIPGNIGITQNSEVVDYFVYLNNSNSFPEITIFRPTNDTVVEAPDYLLTKNKTLIKKYTFLRASTSTKFAYFDLDNFFFPFDEYNFLFVLPVKDYNQKYSADIIFPASFEIKNVSISSPFIGFYKDERISFTVAGILNRKQILESKSIEEYKFRAYIPEINVLNRAQVDKKFGQAQDPNINFLLVKYTYGRPTFFMLIFFISIVFMFLVTYLSHPLSNKSKSEIKQYSLTIGSIWAGQEGVSFLQGHRPLSITLYDFTIVFNLICVIIIYRYPLVLILKSLINSKQNHAKENNKQKTKNMTGK